VIESIWNFANLRCTWQQWAWPTRHFPPSDDTPNRVECLRERKGARNQERGRERERESARKRNRDRAGEKTCTLSLARSLILLFNSIVLSNRIESSPQTRVTYLQYDSPKLHIEASPKTTDWLLRLASEMWMSEFKVYVRSSWLFKGKCWGFKIWLRARAKCRVSEFKVYVSSS